MATLTPARRAELRQWIDSGQAREWREASELTQAEAAALIGVHASTVCVWESQVAEGVTRRYPRGLSAVAYYDQLRAWRDQAQKTGQGRS